MCKSCQNASPLDTLAQVANGIKEVTDSQEFGKLDQSTNVDNSRVLQNRAKRKYISQSLSLGLVKATDVKREEILQKASKIGWTDELIALFNENAAARKSYWNMYHCAGELIKEGKKVTGKYCKNRTCMVCNSIRTAQNLNKYQPVFNAWSDNMYMVTLTIPNCSKGKLKDSIEGMFNNFTKIKNTLRERWRKGKGVKFEGIRKFECTYNPIRNDYHPHFHILVSSKEAGEELLKQWLLKTRRLGTKRVAQDIRKADTNSAIELFKYFTKVVNTPSKVGGERAIYVDALDNIFKAVKGRRTFQNFGFKLADYIEEEEEQEPEEEEAAAATDHFPETYKWNQELADWVSVDTGEILAGHQLSDAIKEVASNIILPKSNIKKPPDS